MIERDPEIEAGVDKFIEEKHKSLQRGYEIGTYHVSDLVGFGELLGQICYRQTYYKYTAGRDIYRREKAGVFERGRTYETKMGVGILPELGWKIVNPIDDKGMYIQEDLEYKTMNNGREIRILAHPDFEVDIAGKRFIVETKSTNFMSRDVFNRFCLEPDFPKEPHILQVNFYAVMKNLPYKLIYISIGDMSVRGWEGEPSQPQFDIIVQRAKILDDYLVNNKIPDGLTSWICDFGQIKKPKTYCDAYNYCRLLGNYGPRPHIYGYCPIEKKIIPESDENGKGILVDNDGRMLCPSCGNRLVRRTLTKKVKDEIDIARGAAQLPAPEGYKEEGMFGS